MKKILFLIALAALTMSCSSSKTSRTKYFDESNNEISRSEFRKYKSTYEYLEIPGDSANQKKLTLRENRGQISNRKSLEKILKTENHIEIDSAKPLIIIYYPGQDKCNEVFVDRPDHLLQWYNELNRGVQKIAEIQPIYIYKNKIGLESLEPSMKWHPDPNETFENLFFKHHYPCQSFVVISSNGNYISYFGEFPKEYVWEATELLSN